MTTEHPHFAPAPEPGAGPMAGEVAGAAANRP